MAPIYKCSNCDYTNCKKDVNRHLLTIKCRNNDAQLILIDEIKTYNCEGCNKQYKSNCGLKYHIERCEEIKKQRVPINILSNIQQQTGNEQLFEIIKNQQETIQELKKITNKVNELEKNQKHTDEKVDKVIKYLSAWHSPYIFEDIYKKFVFSLDEGRLNMMLTFPTFVSEVYSYQENKTICHKNIKSNLVSCHENQKWSIIDSNSVYPTINNNLYIVYLSFLKSELPHETKTIQKQKKIQIDYENENRNNTQVNKTRIKLIEGQFKSNNKQCDITESGKDRKDAIIAQNINYIFKAETTTFEDAFNKTKDKLCGIFNEDSNTMIEEDYIDDEQSDDEDYEHESDKFDSFYNETGDFKGSDSNGIEFLKIRRHIINSRRSNVNWKKELELKI